MLEIMLMSSIFGLVDILRTIGILAFATLGGWIIYRAMKSADVDEENEDSKDQESEENNKKE